MRWARTLFAGLVLLVPLAWDLGRPPAEQVTASWLLAGIDLYQATLSPVMGSLGARCRFQPTCSHYAEVVISRQGTVGGLMSAAGRLLRCGPWTPAGTLDPP